MMRIDCFRNWIDLWVSIVFISFPTLAALTCCTPTISKQLQDEAGAPLPFVELLQHPDGFKGRTVILGGYILETVNHSDGSVVAVLQAPLGFQNEPKSEDLSEGRFLVVNEEFLDPELYSKGRKITVGGWVSGVKEQQLGDTIYRYPVIQAKELYLWSKQASYGRPNVPYWYDPWYPYPYPLRPYPWRYW